MKDIDLATEHFLEELSEIEISKRPILNIADQCIQLCQTTLSYFKKIILQAGFKSVNDEIEFFKNIKQIPLVPLIYYSEIHSFEIQFPKVDLKSQLKFIKKKSHKVNRFFLYNLDFERYIESGQTHFDKEFFTRDYLYGYRITLSKFYFQDPDFCTARDMLLGKYHAFKSLTKYLRDKQNILQNAINESESSLPKIEKMHWPFSNTDYVELVYALHAKGLGAYNNISIIKVSDYLSQIFDVELKDIYKTFQDIKSRKKSRTIFLDELTTSLLTEMDKSEK